MIDVAIIGSGPAGSVAAIACARAALGTVMFERRGGAQVDATMREDEPEESIAPDTVALLKGLGINCAATGAAYFGVATGSSVALFAGTTPAPGRHVRRSWLDERLRAAASRAGAECRLGVEVIGVEPGSRDGFRLLTSAGPVAARWLIDASGRRLWLARRLGLRRRKMSPPLIAWRDIVKESAQSGCIARFTPAADGWTFLAPVSLGRIVRTRLRPARTSGDAASASAPSGEAKAQAATWHIVRHLAGPGWFIAGEAAAALDPAAGCGIAFALRSGLAAGRATAACAADGAVAPVIAARYDDALLGEFQATSAALAYNYHRLGIGVLSKTPPATPAADCGSESSSSPWTGGSHMHRREIGNVERESLKIR